MAAATIPVKIIAMRATIGAEDYPGSPNFDALALALFAELLFAFLPTATLLAILAVLGSKFEWGILFKISTLAILPIFLAPSIVVYAGIASLGVIEFVGQLAVVVAAILMRPRSA